MPGKETTYFKVTAAFQQGCLKITPNLSCAHNSHYTRSMAGPVLARMAGWKVPGCARACVLVRMYGRERVCA